MYKNKVGKYEYERHGISLTSETISKLNRILLSGRYSSTSYGLLVGELIAEIHRNLPEETHDAERE